MRNPLRPLIRPQVAPQRDKLLRFLSEYVQRHGKMPLQKITVEATGIQQGHVCYSLNRLLQLGFVERRRTPNQKKGRLYLTDKGHAHARAA